MRSLFHCYCCSCCFLFTPVQPHATVELVLPDPVTQGITIMAGNFHHINLRNLHDHYSPLILVLTFFRSASCPQDAWIPTFHTPLPSSATVRLQLQQPQQHQQQQCLLWTGSTHAYAAPSPSRLLLLHIWLAFAALKCVACHRDRSRPQWDSPKFAHVVWRMGKPSHHRTSR
jgi:hypothetical protein